MRLSAFVVLLLAPTLARDTPAQEPGPVGPPPRKQLRSDPRVARHQIPWTSWWERRRKGYRSWSPHGREARAALSEGERERLRRWMRRASEARYFDTRCAAAAGLGRLGGDDAVPRLLAMRVERHFEVRLNATLALGLLPREASEEWLQIEVAKPAPGHALREQRAAEAMALAAMESERGLAIVRDRVGRPGAADAPLRSDLIAALAVGRDARALPLLAGLLRDRAEAERVRAAAAAAIGVIGRRAAPSIGDPVPVDPGVVAELSRALAGEPEAPLLRLCCVQALGSLQATACARLVAAAAMRDPDPTTRGHAAIALAQLVEADPSLRGEVRTVLRRLLSKDADASAYAAFALGLIQDRGAIAPLRAALKPGPNPQLCCAASIALSLLGDKGAADQLLAIAAAARGAQVRAHAIQGLARLGGARHRGLLLQMLRGEKVPEVTAALIRTLAALGADDLPAVLLRECEEESNAYQKLALVFALQQFPESARWLQDQFAITRNQELRTMIVWSLGVLGDPRRHGVYEAVRRDWPATLDAPVVRRTFFFE